MWRQLKEFFKTATCFVSLSLLVSSSVTIELIMSGNIWQHLMLKWTKWLWFQTYLKQFILISMQYVLISKLFHEECSSSKPPSFAAFKRLWSSKLVSVYGYPIQEECLNAYIVYIYKSTIVLTHTAVTKSLSSSRCLFWRLPGGSWSAKLPCCTPEQCYHVLLILDIIPCHTGGVYKRSAKTIANSLQILIVRSTKVEIKTLTSAYLHWEIEKKTHKKQCISYVANL